MRAYSNHQRQRQTAGFANALGSRTLTASVPARKRRPGGCGGTERQRYTYGPRRNNPERVIDLYAAQMSYPPSPHNSIIVQAGIADRPLIPAPLRQAVELGSQHPFVVQPNSENRQRSSSRANETALIRSNIRCVIYPRYRPTAGTVPRSDGTPGNRSYALRADSQGSLEIRRRSSPPVKVFRNNLVHSLRPRES